MADLTSVRAKVRLALDEADAALAAPVPTPPPTPAPAPTPTPAPTAALYCKVSELPNDGPMWDYGNKPLARAWRAKGGDWIDRNGVPNGPTPHATFTCDLPARYFDVDATSIAKLLLTRGNTGILLRALTVTNAPPKFSSRRSIAPKIGPPKLHIVTDQGAFDCPVVADCFIAASANTTQLGDSGGQFIQPPGMVLFDLSAVTGAVQSATFSVYLWGWYGVATIAVDYLDMPEIVTQPALRWPDQVEQGIAATVANDRDVANHPDVLAYREFVSTEQVRPEWSWISPNMTDAAGKQSVGELAEFVYWPDYDMHALRVCMHPTPVGASDPGTGMTGANLRLWNTYTAMHAFSTQSAPFPFQRPLGQGYDELWCRFMLVMEADWWDGMNETGIKLPVLEGGVADGMTPDGETPVSPGAMWSAAIHHGPKSFTHPRLACLSTYSYGQWNPADGSGAAGGGHAGTIWDTLAVLEPDRKYCIEMHAKMNDIGAANGSFDVWCDGVKVLTQTGLAWRGDQRAQIIAAPWVLLMHGGMAHPVAPMHYQVAAFVSAKRYVGPPKRI